MSVAEKPHGPETQAAVDEKSGTEKLPIDQGSAPSEENVGQMLTGPQYTPEQTKRLLRRCDKYLLPFLALLYLLSFLDRTNIGNARLANLEEDLNMTGKWDYNVSA
jgi:hypothetical protein